jgi:hypothetical protein
VVVIKIGAVPYQEKSASSEFLKVEGARWQTALHHRHSHVYWRNATGYQVCRVKKAAQGDASMLLTRLPVNARSTKSE